jgi:hypothetical protein
LVQQHAQSLDALNDAHREEQLAQLRLHDLRAKQQQPLPPLSATNTITKIADDEQQQQRLANEAQLRLCDAESNTETKKGEENFILQGLRKEAHNIQYLDRYQLLVSTADNDDDDADH